MRAVSLMIAGLVVALAGPALAKPAYIPSTVNLRAGPGTDKDVLGKIPSGSLIDVGDCTNGWCAVTWQDKSGFAIASAIDLTGRVPVRRSSSRPRYYADEPPIYYEVPPPPVYYGYGPYYGRHFFGPHWGHRRWGW